MTIFTEPFAPLFELSREMDRLASVAPARRSFIPPTDVVVSDDEVKVLMDVPGLTADRLHIELLGDVLTVRGERPSPAHGDDRGAWQQLERGFGTFERRMRVPGGLEPDAVDAALHDGVLTLTIPRPKKPEPHRVEIGTRVRELEDAFESATTKERELVAT